VRRCEMRSLCTASQKRRVEGNLGRWKVEGWFKWEGARRQRRFPARALSPAFFKAQSCCWKAVEEEAGCVHRAALIIRSAAAW
jgi:hypothetical protein